MSASSQSLINLIFRLIVRQRRALAVKPYESSLHIERKVGGQELLGTLAPFGIYVFRAHRIARSGVERATWRGRARRGRRRRPLDWVWNLERQAAASVTAKTARKHKSLRPRSDIQSKYARYVRGIVVLKGSFQRDCVFLIVQVGI